MAFFPAAVATTANLYTAVNSLQTTLATGLGTSDTSVVLASSTGFPTAGAVTIDNEVIFYTGVSGATLTGCTRGSDGTTAAVHSVGVPVGASIIAFHHNGLMTEVIAIETFLNTKFGTSGSAYTVSRALQTNASTGIPEVSSVTNTELGYLSGVTSAIQTQFSGKVGTTGNETIAGIKTFSSTPVLSSGQINLTSTNTAAFQLASQAAGHTYTIPDAGNDANFLLSKGSPAFAAALAMGANKITGLANGTASTDAMAFGQNKVVQIVYASSQTDFTTTSSAYQSTNSTVSITPTSSSNKVLVIAMGIARNAAWQTSNNSIALFRNSTNLSTASQTQFQQVRSAGVSGFTTTLIPGMLSWIDAPATTSATTYTVKISSTDNSTLVGWGNGSDTFIMAIEVVA